MLGVARIGNVTGLHVNTAGIRMATSSLLCLYFLHEKDVNKKEKFFYLFCFILFIILAFLTGSKKAIIILFCGIILFELYLSKGLKFIFKMFAFFLVAIVLYHLLMNNIYFQNVIGRRMSLFLETITGNAETDYSFIERKFYIEEAKKLFLEYPIFGYGGNNFMSHIRNIGYSHIAYSHNNFFELLSTLGIIGFVIYYYMWIRIIYMLIKNYLNQKINLILIFMVIIIINFVMDYGHVCYYTDFNILLLIIAYLIAKQDYKIKSNRGNIYENSNRC